MLLNEKTSKESEVERRVYTPLLRPSFPEFSQSCCFPDLVQRTLTVKTLVLVVGRL